MKQKQINYPEIKTNDIKVLGRVVSITSANKVAAAELVFDEGFDYDRIGSYAWNNIIDATGSGAGMDQYTINRLFGKKLKKWDEVFELDEEGWIVELKVRNLIADKATINNKLTTKDLKVTNNADINNLHVSGNSIFDGNVNIAGNLTVNNNNITDKIDQLFRIISGEDKTSSIWQAITALQTWKTTVDADLSWLKEKVNYLLQCCEDMQNRPQGGITLNVNPESIDFTVGDPDIALSASTTPQIVGSATFTSNDTSVCTIVNGNKAHAVAEGSTTITVTFGDYTKSIPVIVHAPAPVTYTVRFNSNNGVPAVIDNQTVTEGNKAIAPQVTRDGYTLDGWHIETLSGNVWDFNTPVTSNLNLIAGWTENEPEQPETQYTITYYDITSGQNTTDNPTAIILGTQQYAAGDSITEMNETTARSAALSKGRDRSGYNLGGWHNIPYGDVMPANDIAAFAIWTEIENPPSLTHSLVIKPNFTTYPNNNEWRLENNANVLDNGGTGMLELWAHETNAPASDTTNDYTVSGTWTAIGENASMISINGMAEETQGTSCTFTTNGAGSSETKTVTIQATHVDFAEPATITITLSPVTETPEPEVHVYTLSISPDQPQTITSGENGITFVATPMDNGSAITGPQTVAWTSSNLSAATVDGGTVTPVSGLTTSASTTITATWASPDGIKTATCEVTVNPAAVEPEPQQTPKLILEWSGAGEHGTITNGGTTILNGDDIPYGSTWNATVTADQGYKIYGLQMRMYGATGYDTIHVTGEVGDEMYNSETGQITVPNVTGDLQVFIFTLVDTPPVLRVYPSSEFITVGENKTISSRSENVDGADLLWKLEEVSNYGKCVAFKDDGESDTLIGGWNISLVGLNAGEANLWLYYAPDGVIDESVTPALCGITVTES